MIYVAALGVRAKRIFKKDVQQSRIDKIIENLPLDPKTTNMDVVMLEPKDARGILAAKLSNAIKNAHPDICIIYLYVKDADKDILPVEYKHKCKTFDSKNLQSAFDEFIKDHNIARGKTQMTSADFQAIESEAAAPVNPSLTAQEPEENFNMAEFLRNLNNNSTTKTEDVVETHDMLEEEVSLVSEHKPVYIQPEIKEDYTTGRQSIYSLDSTGTESIPSNAIAELDEVPITEVDAESVAESTVEKQPLNTMDIPQDQSQPVLEQQPLDTASRQEKTAPIPTVNDRVEDFIKNASNPEDWSILREKLRHNTIVNSLIADNAEYKGVVQMLEVLDKRIQAIYRDTALTPDEKFDKIKEIGMERSTLRATTNSFHIERTISIISAIAISAKQAVDYRVESIDKAMHKIIVDRSFIEETSEINKAIEERTKTLTNLLNLSRDIVELFKSINALACDEIDQLDKQLPSANAFVNGWVRPIGTDIFTPANTGALANKMMQALRNNAITISQVEEQVNTLIKYMFDLFDKDEELIRYQSDKINLLRANRVESMVTATTLLKKVTRLFVGAENTGKTATALTWSGVLSRRQNVILLDMSPVSKLAEYGVQTVSVDEFLAEPIHTELLCVNVGNKLSPTELQTLMETVNARLQYYAHVNIIVSAVDKDLISQLMKDSIVIHYVTDCSQMSMAALRFVRESISHDNIGVKLATIDAPVSPLTIASNIGIDPTNCQYIPIPRITNIRACAIRHDQPYTYTDIVKVFEEAFS